MTINQIVERLKTNKSYLDNGAGSLAKKWKCSVEDIKRAKLIVRGLNTETVSTSESLGVYNGIEEKKEDLSTGETTIKFHHSDECLSEDQIWEETKMDRNKWNFVQIYHKKFGKGFLYTANFRIKQTNTQEFFQESFQDFLKGYKPKASSSKKLITSSDGDDTVSVIIPKQDAHFDKFDIKGNNDIHTRIDILHDSVLNIIADISCSQNIKEIVYVVGSDQFNSEWTSLTTKGTPQSNLCTYEDGFQIICDGEVEMIELLRECALQVKVVYIPGNHDRYVGWHLINWLQCYFRDTDVVFDLGIENTKYHRFNNTGIMLNHGDAQKPKDLASKFPQGFKSQWSQCDNFLIICGDKHHEKALDIDGIQYYQVPQLSASTSYWDDKNGYTHSKVEMNIFTIGSSKGLKRIYKDSLK